MSVIALGSDTDASTKIIQCTQHYMDEAKSARETRMKLNRQNFDSFLNRADFSHKKQGQSQEFLPKQSLAVQQISSFVHQALVDTSEDWFSVDLEDGMKPEEAVLTPDEVQKLLDRQLRKLGLPAFVEDSIKMGLLGSLMIAKVHGEYVKVPKFTAERAIKDGKAGRNLVRKDDLIWRLRLDLIRQEDYYPDPTDRNKYKLAVTEMDLADVKALSQGEHAIYDPAEVAKIVGGYNQSDQEAKKARETGQNTILGTSRKAVKITEGWGTLYDPTTGDIIMENCTWTIANDLWLIQKPTPNPFWHGEDPFVVAPLLRVPRSVWHKAMMDAPTQLNTAITELFNLILDSGFMAVYGVRQLHTSWLVDPTVVDGGIGPGKTLEVTDACPPGAKVMDVVQTAEMAQEAVEVFNILQSEFQTSALTNDLRMGVLPQRAVKATEVVEANQTLSSMFTGLTKVIESTFIEPLLKKAWLTIAQNANDLDSNEVKALLGKDAALKLSAAPAELRFASTAQGLNYKVYGLSNTLGKMQDFKKVTTLMQVISGSEVLMEEFSKKYDFGKLLQEMMRSLNIDTSRLELSATDQLQMQMAGGAGGPMQPGSTQPGSTPNQNSQTPQASALKGPSPTPQPAAMQGPNPTPGANA